MDCNRICWNCPELETYNTLFLKGYKCRKHGLLGKRIGIISYQADRGALHDYQLKDSALTDLLARKAEQKYKPAHAVV